MMKILPLLLFLLFGSVLANYSSMFTVYSGRPGVFWAQETVLITERTSTPIRKCFHFHLSTIKSLPEEEFHPQQLLYYPLNESEDLCLQISQALKDYPKVAAIVFECQSAGAYEMIQKLPNKEGEKYFIVLGQLFRKYLKVSSPDWMVKVDADEKEFEYFFQDCNAVYDSSDDKGGHFLWNRACSDAFLAFLIPGCFGGIIALVIILRIKYAHSSQRNSRTAFARKQAKSRTKNFLLSARFAILKKLYLTPVSFNELDSNKFCPFCLDDFEEGMKLFRCSCRHQFHERCIEQWIHKKTCPLCRQRLDGESWVIQV